MRLTPRPIVIAHDPMQGMRQGNVPLDDLLYGDEQLKAAQKSKDAFQSALKQKG